MSLRWRISLAFALTVALMAFLFGLLVYQKTAADLASHARTLEVQRAQIAASLFARTGTLAFAATVNDPSAPGALRRAIAAGDLATFLGDGSGTPFVWAGAPLNDGRGAIFVRASFLPEEQVLSALRRSLLEIGALVTLATALLGWLFAWPLSRRLRSAARTAARIGAGGQHLGPGGRRVRIAMDGRDEVAALAGAVDRMADSLEQRIEREQRFAANVAHELRTPVSGLVAASALLGGGEPAAMVRDRAQLLARLVEDLLEISRLEAGAETLLRSHVDLALLARSACADLPVRVIGANARVWSDPRRIARIIVNLAENALRHGAEPILVEVEDGCLRISDKGPGFSAEMLAHATERFASGSRARTGGSGLGLAIAAAQARVIGATMRLENQAGGGAIVTVLLPDLHETAISGL